MAFSMSVDTSGMESEIYEMSCHESLVVIVSLGSVSV